MAGEKKKNLKAKSKEIVRDRMGQYGGFFSELGHDKALWFIIYFTVVLAYLLLNQGGSVDLTRAPQWAFRAFAFAGLLLFSILDGRKIRESLARINLKGILPISLIIFLVSSNIVSIRPFETTEETMNILAYASMAFLTYVYIDSLRRLRQLLEIIMVAGFLIAFHGLFIFYGAYWSKGETTPLSSLFYWHNPCAGFLLLIWPIMLAQYYALRRGWQTFLILYIFFFTFTAFMLTLSRGGWLAGFIPFFLIPMFFSRRKLLVVWRPVLLFVLYFLSALPFIIKYYGRFLRPIVDRWNQFRFDDYSVVGRFEFWTITWKVFLKHPIFGIGFNTFGYYYVHYQSDPQYYTKDPHNIYLRFLVEGGIIGLVVILSVVAIVYKLLVKTLKAPEGKMITVYRVGLLSAIIAEMSHMALDFDWTFPVLPMLLLCEIAILARTFTYSKAEQELPVTEWEPDEKADLAPMEPETPSVKGWYIKPVAVWRTLAAILFVINMLGYQSMVLSEKGDNLIQNQLQIAQARVEESMSQLQVEAFRSQTQETPDFNIELWQARSDIVIEARDYWVRSLNWNPWNWRSLKSLLNAFYNEAKNIYVYGQDGDLDRAIALGLDYGYRLLHVTPHRPATHYYLGQHEILVGRIRGDDELKEAGLAKLLMAIELDPKNIPKYYLGIAEYYYAEGEFDTALEYIDTLEGIFVPLYDTGDIDFGALKGKSLARHDWIDITETMRDAWWLKGEIYLLQDKKEEAIEALYHGLNTPVGGGELVEPYMDLGELQFRFAVRIAETAAEIGDWETVYNRAKQALDILEERGMLNQPETLEETRMLQRLYAEAEAEIIMSADETGSVPDPAESDIYNESPEE